MLPIIDTHQHMWDLTRFSLPWLEGTGAEPLRKNHSQSEYREASAGTGIARTIYMEVDVIPDQRIAESVNHCLDSFGPGPGGVRRRLAGVQSGAESGRMGGGAARYRLRQAAGRAGQLLRRQRRTALWTGVIMDPFEKVAIGTTGVKVTRLGLGGAPLGGMVLAEGIFQGSDYDEALTVIRRAYEMGVRYFDTAPLYGNGRSEVRYGRVLGEFPRQSFAISTKGSRVLRPENPDDLAPCGGDGIPRYTYDFDFSAEGLRASLNSSLKRLGTGRGGHFLRPRQRLQGAAHRGGLHRRAGGRGGIAGKGNGQGHRHGYERVGAHWPHGGAL